MWIKCSEAQRVHLSRLQPSEIEITPQHPAQFIHLVCGDFWPAKAVWISHSRLISRHYLHANTYSTRLPQVGSHRVWWVLGLCCFLLSPHFQIYWSIWSTWDREYLWAWHIFLVFLFFAPWVATCSGAQVVWNCVLNIYV